MGLERKVDGIVGPVTSPLNTPPGRHFHTFDALRFFAFLKVFFFHVPATGFGVFGYFMSGGSLAVRFFFVLSGFLITYLILVEKEWTGRLNFKYFMLRRVLRIWPLYYLIIAFAFFTPVLLSVLTLEHSDEGYAPNFLYTAAFLENYVTIVKREAPNVSPLGVIWSICVEEHFYIIWGLLLAYLPTRDVPRLISTSIVLALVSRSVFFYFGLPPYDLLTNLDLFAIGAIPAYVLVARPNQLEHAAAGVPRSVKWLYVAVLVGAVSVAPHLSGPVHEVVGPTVMGLMFGGLVSMFLSARSNFRIADANIFSRLGKYTYGLYLYHVIIINLLAVLFRRAGRSVETFPDGLLLVVVALGVSIVVSALSYRYFERPFLSLKRYAPPKVRAGSASAGRESLAGAG
jgi:peptidoglycan/LPS O-acetylase OafA/YrhL